MQTFKLSTMDFNETTIPHIAMSWHRSVFFFFFSFFKCSKI